MLKGGNYALASYVAAEIGRLIGINADKLNAQEGVLNGKSEKCEILGST